MPMPAPTVRFACPLLLGLALALGACSSQPDKDEPPFISTQTYLKSAYTAPQHFKFASFDTRWAWGGQQQDGQRPGAPEQGKHELDLSLLVPEGVKNVPVIIYLPGLGEGANGGELWRQTWADAGYAVLSIQATRDNASIYNSSNARDGAFRTIAANAFADAPAANRVAEVNRILSEARRRGQAGEAGFAALDTSKVAVAGFDLGAQTAAALAGERQPGQPRPVDWKPLATILLSPYVPGGVDDRRYSQIDSPLLAVTGPMDEDPFSWIASAQQRFALFRGLSHDGYQLTLNDATHTVLSGTIAKVDKSDKKPRGGEDDPSGPNRRPGRPANPGFDARQAGSVAAVTIAFLDARLKQSATAQQWLDDKAQNWLAPVGGLQRK
ncbi:MAG: alpha/beta hydrolase family protein [Janthinobacterium lividum]